MIEGAQLGKGKYGDIAEEIIKKLDAKGVLLVVVDGTRGSGMSLTAPYWEMGGQLEFMRNVPTLLRGIADSIDAMKGATDERKNKC